MTLRDLPAGESVFLDANLFIYHFHPHPTLTAPCNELVDRIENGEVAGFTSAHVLAEAAHRLMTIEACDAFGWPFAGIAQRLRQHPAEVRTLVRFREAIQKIPQYGVQVLVSPPDAIDAAAAVSQQTGLLTNDALLVVVMQAHGLANLASHDADFDRVPGLTRYAPI